MRLTVWLALPAFGAAVLLGWYLLPNRFLQYALILEKRFGISILDEEAAGLRTIKDIITFVDRKVRARPHAEPAV